MTPVLVLFKKSVLLFARSKPAMLITFLVPAMLIYLFGHVFGLYKKENSGPTGIRLAIVNLSTEPAATDLIDALKLEKAFRVITETKNPDGTPRPLTEADVRAGLRNSQYRYALLLPADLISGTTLGIHLKFLSDPRNDIEAQMVNGLLQKTIFSRVPQLLGQSLQRLSQNYLGTERFETFNRALAQTIAATYGGDEAQIYQRLIAGDFGFSSSLSGSGFTLQAPSSTPATPPADSSTLQAPRSTPAPSATSAADLFSRIARIETEQVSGKKVTNPNATRLIGGYGIMFLLFALSGSATSLFEEKRSGIFLRILAAPVRPAHILVARFLFGIALGSLQLSVLLLTGKFLFGIDLFSHVGALAVLIVSAAAACTAFGMLLAAVSATQEMANGLTTLLVLAMSAIGGAWFPVSFMPEFIQAVSKFTIVYWAVEGFTSILWAGRTLVEMLPTYGVLLGTAAAVMAAALACFKRGKVFD